MTSHDELQRLRAEAKKLRQENATLARSKATQTTRANRGEQQNTAFAHTIKKLNEEIKHLKAENNDLKIRLGISIDNAKKFAGMIFKSNVRKRGETKQSRRRGTRGHTGVGRKKPDHIDQEIDVYLTNCFDCGNPLNRTSSVDERVVEDIPQTLPVTTLYHIERQWCTQCHKEVRGVPSGTIPSMRFGIGVVVLVLFLKYSSLRLSSTCALAKIEEILLSQHKLTITSQGIQEILHTLKTRFAKQYKDILEEIRNAPMKHADETSWRIDGINAWCWLFATPSAALYTIEETRGKDVPAHIFGHDPTGVLVRDDCPSYASLPMSQQSCWSHLLRVSHDAAVHEDASEEMKTLHEELTQMFTELDVIIREPYRSRARKRHYDAYTEKIDAIIARSYTHDDAQAVQTRITNQRTNLITTLLYEGVPLTNNHAERMIRPMVITRKISGGSRSDKGAATHAVNMSVMQTLSLKGKDFFTGINEILHAGNKRYVLGNG